MSDDDKKTERERYIASFLFGTIYGKNQAEANRQIESALYPYINFLCKNYDNIDEDAFKEFDAGAGKQPGYSSDTYRRGDFVYYPPKEREKLELSDAYAKSTDPEKIKLLKDK